MCKGSTGLRWELRWLTVRSRVEALPGVEPQVQPPLQESTLSEENGTTSGGEP